MTKRCMRYAVFAVVAFIWPMMGAHAQELEPRSYSNTPVGLNFLLASYAYTEGKLAFDPSTSVVDAQYRLRTEALHRLTWVKVTVVISGL